MINPSFGNKNSKKRHIISDINVTPFVDVLLVLLIIFMVAAPLLHSTVNINLPQGSTKVLQQKTQPIFVSVTADGKIFLGEDKIRLSLLGKKLRQLTNNNLDNKIYIRADKTLDYGKVMRVVKIISRAGFNKISLATELAQ